MAGWVQASGIAGRCRLCAKMRGRGARALAVDKTIDDIDLMRLLTQSTSPKEASGSFLKNRFIVATAVANHLPKRTFSC